MCIEFCIEIFSLVLKKSYSCVSYSSLIVEKVQKALVAKRTAVFCTTFSQFKMEAVAELYTAAPQIEVRTN